MIKKLFFTIIFLSLTSLCFAQGHFYDFGSNYAYSIWTDTSNFDKILSASDNTVQKALEAIDAFAVSGPTVSTDHALARFDGITGKLIQDYTSGAPTASDTGQITGNLIGDVTGNVSGSSGSCTGNAATVTNGVYTTDNLSVLSSTTSAQLAGVISDETGSGLVVFGTSPSLITSAVLSDAFTLGLGTGKGLIQFDDETTDFLSFSNCYVGIRTTTPAAPLDVSGPTIIRSISSPASQIAWVNHLGNNGWYLYEELDGDVYMSLKNKFDTSTVFLDTEGNSWFTGGNVGIGTNTPGTELDVSGTANATTITEGGVAVINATEGGTWTGTHDYNAATLEIPNSAAPTIDATGRIGVDTDIITQGMLEVWLTSTLGYVVATTDTPGDNEVPTFDLAGGTIQWETAGGSGDLKADGSVPLTANWDVGAYTITGTQFISDIAIGTAPFVVTSTTEVANLKSATATLATTATDTASKTGTGSTYVTNTSPTLVTPALGTPSALVGTNISGTAVNLTVGNATLAATATALATARAIGGVNFDGTAAITPTTIVVADTADTTSYVGLWTDASGSLLPKTDGGILYNASTGQLSSTSMLVGNSGGIGFIDDPDTYIKAEGGDGGIMYFKANNVTVIGMDSTNFSPATTGTIDTGSAGAYWGAVNYKTLEDRGCLGWFDEGVELQDGTFVSDLEALEAIKKHPTKLTIYDTPMLDYKTFPKVAYKPADKDGKLMLRDENDEPYWFDKEGVKKPASDGVEMTSMFSIFIGAFKELNARVTALEIENIDLKKRIEALEKE